MRDIFRNERNFRGLKRSNRQQFKLDESLGCPVGSMWHDEPKAREAFRQGARDAFESSVIHMDAREKRALAQWLVDLEEWQDGEPPLPPVNW